MFLAKSRTRSFVREDSTAFGHVLFPSPTKDGIRPVRPTAVRFAHSPITCCPWGCLPPPADRLPVGVRSFTPRRTGSNSHKGGDVFIYLFIRY